MDTCSVVLAVCAGETKIGISYAKLCQSVGPGKRILMADGSLVIEVLEILSDTELRGRCLNGKALGPKKNVNLPGKTHTHAHTRTGSHLPGAAHCRTHTDT